MKRRKFIAGTLASAVASVVVTADVKAEDKVNDPVTIIKVGDQNYRPTADDLEHWRQIFTGETSREEMFKKFPHMKDAPIEVIENAFDSDPDYHSVTIVKVGSENFQPTAADLEAWRNIFEEAAYDKDFKIFTHSNVEVEQIKFGKSGKIIVE
jgi:hypothetical protein